MTTPPTIIDVLPAAAARRGPPAPVPPIRHQTTLPKEGAYWLLATAGLWLTGWLKGINLVLVLAYLLMLLWMLNWFAARRALRGAAAARKLPNPVFAQTPVSWEVEASATGRRPVTGWEVIDEGPGHALRWFLLNVRPGKQVRLRSELTLPRRGDYECRPLRAASSFPFGLVRAEVSFRDGERLTVLPRLGVIHVGRLRRWLMQSARPDERARRARRAMAVEAEFHGLRQFRPGDSPRWIHWRTTARTGELVVREFDQGSHHDLLLLVDPAGEPDLVERAISLAATVCWAWTRESGDRIVLAIAGAEPVTVAGGAGPDAVLELLEALARVRPAGESDVKTLEPRLHDLPLPGGPALMVGAKRGRGAADEWSERLERPVAYLSAAEPPPYYQFPARGDFASPDSGR